MQRAVANAGFMRTSYGEHGLEMRTIEIVRYRRHVAWLSSHRFIYSQAGPVDLKRATSPLLDPSIDLRSRFDYFIPIFPLNCLTSTKPDMYQPNRSSTRAGARTRTIICLDFGGRNIRVSTAVTDGTNKPVFKQIKTWPGKPGQSDFVPNLVIESKETDQQLWGYEAENALSDDPSKYQCHYDLKRYLMNVSGNGSGPDAPGDKNSRENVCLTLISGLLNHAIGTPQPTSLLIIVAVPTHVKARGANRYLEIWSQASPIDSENTTVWVADEAEMGGRGTEMTAPLDTNDGHVLCTRVDVGSTTMVSPHLQRT